MLSRAACSGVWLALGILAYAVAVIELEGVLVECGQFLGLVGMREHEFSG